MNIVGIANQNNKSDFNTTVSTYTLASIALFDAFIACWESKFKTNYVRPETVITKHLNPDWRPYLQTPPFPEYTSGHAVISAATAEVLTAAFGDNVPFRDTSSTAFGIPERSFKSFRQAAMEAGQSRVYGGIHYTNSCLVGTKQGEEVGRIVVERLKVRRHDSPLSANN
jgi:membrane-associated phospholipid phosphatase